MSTRVEKTPAAGAVGAAPGLSGCVAAICNGAATGKLPERPGPAGPPGERHAISSGRCSPASRRRTSLPLGWIAEVRSRAVHWAIHLRARARKHAARPPQGPTSARAFEEAMGETDIPAEQPETEEEARIPAPDAQSSGPCGDSTSPQQGPFAAFGLIWRVRGQSSFRTLARGRRRSVGVLEVRATVIGSDGGPPRVAFSVGRPVGNAVTRNRVRRQLRAAVREHRPKLEPSTAYLVRAAPGAAGASYAALSNTLREILTSLSSEPR
jgi:ribonuclease P protein component